MNCDMGSGNVFLAVALAVIVESFVFAGRALPSLEYQQLECLRGWCFVLYRDSLLHFDFRSS